MKAVRLDPRNFEWHQRLANWLRLCRKAVVDTSSEPSSEEIQILWETFSDCDYEKCKADGSPSELQSIALSNLCHGLAELIRARKYNRSTKMTMNLPFVFGGFSFANANEAVEFIRENVKM
jgi:hypothetical protein